MDAGTDFGQAGGLFGASKERGVSRMTRCAIQFLDQDLTFQFRIELAGGQSGDDHLREDNRSVQG